MKHTMRRLTALVLALALTVSTVFATDYTATTVEEFYAYLQSAWDSQERSFTIIYTGVEELASGYVSLAQFQRTMAASSADAANGDYTALNLSDGKLNTYQDKYIFSTIEYLDSQEEIAYVQAQAVEIVDSLDIRDQDDFTKIKTIYEYMTSSFVYDKSLSLFSANDILTQGTAVCQGYALLTNYLLEEAGLNARLISGTSQSEPHAWNQVEWEGLWYSLDTTWDTTSEAGTPGTWNFFMKGTEDFQGHTVYDQYLDPDYLKDHPQAENGYPLESLTITDDEGITVSGLVVRLGIPVQMDAITPDGAADNSLVWSSDDPDVLDVTPEGEITGISLGTTWLNVESGDNPDWIGGKISVVTVDMTTLSSWSADIVTEYYLAQMLPSDQCHDYQDAITRLDLARLVDQLVYKTSGYDIPSTVKNPFSDVSDSEIDTYDFYAVMRCYLSGIMEGTSDTTFEPDKWVTREEAAAVLVRAQAYVQGASYTVQNDPNFTDSDTISSWAVSTIASAQEQGLLQGNANGTFDPQGQMTREQMIVALSRVYDQFVG